jgi:hypothetical protein
MRLLASKDIEPGRVRVMRELLGRPEDGDGDDDVIVPVPTRPDRSQGGARTSAAVQGQGRGRDGQRGGDERRDDQNTRGREQPPPLLDAARLAVVEARDGRLRRHVTGGQDQDQGGRGGSGGSSRHPNWEALDATRRLYGRRGEEAAYEAERNRLRALGVDPDCVRWISQNDELADHDLESLDADGEIIYIEVKSTNSADPSEPFLITSAELRLAARHRPHYYVYRVTRVREAVPSVTRFRDPIGLWQQGKAETEVTQARMWLPKQDQEGGTVSAAASTEAHQAPA